MIGASLLLASTTALRLRTGVLNATTEAGDFYDPSICDPPCIEGHGTCINNMCLCRHPWEGSTCQKDVNVMKMQRLRIPLAVGVIVTSFIVGVCAAGVLCQMKAYIFGEWEPYRKHDEIQQEIWFRQTESE
jgi:hypothetical protein